MDASEQRNAQMKHTYYVPNFVRVPGAIPRTFIGKRSPAVSGTKHESDLLSSAGHSAYRENFR